MIELNKYYYIPVWDYTVSRDVNMNTDAEWGVRTKGTVESGKVTKMDDTTVTLLMNNSTSVAIKRDFVRGTKKECRELLNELWNEGNTFHRAVGVVK